ncbi:HEXXH motif-containing putative peptide modification protein [Oceanicola sp. 502str15]|uniref:aKG-HExxH-type peptide beta-hydroxylase n=1 Tax=Oceanicola sp. 502str15 TaxID=2696061 RepID=UPI0020961E19|nr:HEXXH motif-containing putative peptide modification protein [Oceanicola sp. 502str15]MCO6381104.1 HEXXH motif domain-containing protein [Oceanicola sp. 502str15]
MTPENLLAFPPDADRAGFLDSRMHRELSASLAHLAEACAEAHHPAATPLAEAARLLQNQRVGPEAFARYFLIGTALLEGREAEVEADAVALLADVRAGRAPFRVSPRGGAGELDGLMDRQMGEEAACFAPVAPETAATFATLLDTGLDLLCAGLPALHAEITTITHHVVAATAPDDATMQFDGASHYQFWGLLLLNPRFHTTRLAIAEVLAHESAHSLLFGLTIDDPLVLNAEGALFASPLRADPRPMDGIYHATFVSARMAWAMEGLAASGLLSPEEHQQALAAARSDRANFHAGNGVIEAHGLLSPTGETILRNARNWIAA